MGTYLFGVSLSLDTLEQAAEDLGAVERVLVEMYNPIVRARFGQRVVRPKYPSGDCLRGPRSIGCVRCVWCHKSMEVSSNGEPVLPDAATIVDW